MKDGTRTRDRQGHNLELYHLSYLHHRAAAGLPRSGRLGYHRRFAGVIIRPADWGTGVAAGAGRPGGRHAPARAHQPP